jgi:hypothetical protein
MSQEYTINVTPSSETTQQYRPIHHTKTHEINKNQKTNLKIIHWNCNSIKDKIDTLKAFLQDEKPDLMSLNEIKCNETEANNIFYIDNYLP